MTAAPRCWTTFEWRYVPAGNLFVKRSLRPDEFVDRLPAIPYIEKGDGKTEKRSGLFAICSEDDRNSVPKLLSTFVDGGDFYLIKDYIGLWAKRETLTTIATSLNAALNKETKGLRSLPYACALLQCSTFYVFG